MGTAAISFRSMKFIKNSKKEYTGLEYSYLAEGGKVDLDETRKDPPHEDLVNAVKKLRVHLGMLCGIINRNDVKDPQAWGTDIDNIHVNSFAISGEDDGEDIIISGYRIIPESKRALILNSPLQRFNDEDANPYKHVDDLVDVLDEIFSEIKMYMAGKIAPSEQLGLNFDKAGVHADDEELVSK